MAQPDFAYRMSAGMPSDPWLSTRRWENTTQTPNFDRHMIPLLGVIGAHLELTNRRTKSPLYNDTTSYQQHTNNTSFDVTGRGPYRPHR